MVPPVSAGSRLSTSAVVANTMEPPRRGVVPVFVATVGAAAAGALVGAGAGAVVGLTAGAAAGAVVGWAAATGAVVAAGGAGGAAGAHAAPTRHTYTNQGNIRASGIGIQPVLPLSARERPVYTSADRGRQAARGAKDS